MQVTVTARHTNANDSTRTYAEEKFGRVAKIYDAEPAVAEVVLSEEARRAAAKRYIAEVTIRLKGHVVRAEEASSDMHSAIDLAADKAEAQMRKYKSRVIDRRNGRGGGATVVKTAAGDAEMPSELEEERPPVSVRVKTMEVQAMDEEEAILQMELLGHDFFLFRDPDSGSVCVLYRRRNGEFGVIKPAD